MTKPLRIGLIMLGGKDWIGGSEYIKNIILALSSLPTEIQDDFQISLLYRESSTDPDVIHQLRPYLTNTYNLDKLKPNNLFNIVKWGIQKYILDEPSPRLSDLPEEVDLDFVYPYYLINQRKLKSNLQGCPWIADFQHKYLPHLFSEAEIRYRDAFFSKIARLSQRVVLSSNSAASDFRKFFPNSNTKIEILQFKTSIQESWYEQDFINVQQKYNLPNHFFLVSNQFWQHKNHEIIFEALKILKDRLIYPIIAFTGATKDYRNSNYMNTILQRINVYGLESQAYLLGLIPKKDQMQLMRRSIAVIQPSLSEGWSTVVEDARCLGKKIILSDISVHLEQNPPNGMFFDRYSSKNLADLICECWHNPNVTPDIEQETLARARNIKEVQEFGYHFLSIVKGNI